jgi:probable rRNA maturation factor
MSAASKSPAAENSGGRSAVAIVGLEPRLHGWLAARLEAALAFLNAGGEVRVRVVDDAAMAEAHVKYSGVAGTTDVLTFNLAENDNLDVDILVCRDEAVRQAAARGHGIDRELLLYAVHGVLHCLGHDDHDEAGAARMHTEEDRILEAIGVARTYATGGSGGGGGGG